MRNLRVAEALLLGTLLMTFPASAREIAPTDEAREKDGWLKQNLSSQAGGRAPFSFMYGGQPSAALLPSWKSEAKDARLDDQRTGHVLSWTDPQSGLVVRCRAVEYHDFPTVEWTLYLRKFESSSGDLFSVREYRLDWGAPFFVLEAEPISGLRLRDLVLQPQALVLRRHLPTQ